jgi:hypothetical protein
MCNSRVLDLKLSTNFIQQSPCWADNRCSASQEILRFTKPERSLSCSQGTATCPYPKTYKSSPLQSHPSSFTAILKLPSHLSLKSAKKLFLSGFVPSFLYAHLLSPMHTLKNHIPVFLMHSVLSLAFNFLDSVFVALYCFLVPLNLLFMETNFILQTFFQLLQLLLLLHHRNKTKYLDVSCLTAIESSAWSWLLPSTFCALVKNTWRYTSTPPSILMAWCLINLRDKCTLPSLTVIRPINHKQQASNFIFVWRLWYAILKTKTYSMTANLDV